MKQFRLLLTILTLLAVGSMNTWAETKTITLTYSSFGLTTTYASKTATIENFDFTIDQGYKGSANNKDCIQMNSSKGSGILYNTTPIPGLKSITVNVAKSGKTYTITTGTTSKPTTSAGTGTTTSTINVKNSGDTYFQLKVSGACYFSSIVITYETAAPCATPTFTIEDKTISLSEAANLYDMSTNLTINKGGSTGAITYACDDEKVIIEGNTFYAETAGTYTINATMAADATYCEATTSFTITVVPCTTSLATPTGLNTSNITATTADLSWTAVPNATEYKITYGDAENPGTKQATATGTTYTLTNLTPQTGYIWAVKAIGDGATYCDSEDSQSGDFTTAAPPKYTITWSANGNATTTQVTEGDAIGTLPADPSAPSGCSDKVFVGWSITNIGATPTNDKPEFITANTIPTGNTTYYAVFATKSGSGAGGWKLVTSEKDLVAGEIYAIGSSSTANNGKVLGGQNENNRAAVDWSSTALAKLTLGGAKDMWTLYDGTGYLYAASSLKNYLRVQTINNDNGKWSITFSNNAATIEAQGDNTRNLLRYNSSNTIFSCYSSGQSPVYLFHYSAGISYTDYITECVDCTAPAEALALTLSQETANLGQDGNAVVTFNTTGGNGTAVTYAVTPTTGATLSGTTITFTQEGTYTLTASQTYTTTGGTTYCGGTDSKTITIAPAEYTLSLYDRGSKSTAGNYYAGAKVPQPTDPTGVCTEPINYVFDGWATAEVAEGSTTYTKVAFPYTMPKANTTLYAVYKYVDGNSAETGASPVSADGIVDGGQYYITATAKDGKAYMLKAGSFSAGNSGDNTAVFDAATVTSDKAWTFVKNTGGEGWFVKYGENKLGTTNGNNELSCSSFNTGLWTCNATTSGSSTVILTYASYSRKLALYASTPNWRTYTTANGAQTIQLYSPVSYLYTTSPVCGPYVRITSGKELYVTAGNAGGTRSTVQVQDTVKFEAGNLQGSNGNEPKVKIPAADITCNGAATTKVTAALEQTATDNGDGTYSIKGTVILTYKPTDFDVREDITLQLRAEYNTGDNVTLDAVTLHARSLPEKFVIVANSTDWYALNADMSGSSAQPANSHVTVDETADAAKAPCNTLYTFDGMPNGGDKRYVRFVGASGKYLWAASADNVGVQNYAGNTPAATNDSYNWLLTTSDNVTYTFSNPQNSRTLRLNDSKFAMYVSGVQEFRILPVTDTCVFNYAPANFRTETVKSTSVTLAWDAVAGATMYQLSTDGTTWTDVTGATFYIVNGLASTTEYTYHLRARHGDGTDICSDVTSLTFTTSDCDDVPYNLAYVSKLTSVILSWKATAATATVRVYTDADCKALFGTEHTNVSSPFTIEGLEKASTYYVKVFAGGTCVSEVLEVHTDAPQMDVVEWAPDHMDVSINTDEKISVLLENQVTKGSGTGMIADELFFSKYFEATGNVKLVAVYNGTGKEVDITDYKIKYGKNQWESANSADKYIPIGEFSETPNVMAPAEEIILYSTGSASNDVEIMNCLDNTFIDAPWKEVTAKNNTGGGLLSFAGNKTIALFKGDEAIDVIGGIDDSGNPISTGTSMYEPSWGDDPGWTCETGTSIKDGSVIGISTNRCLLVRKNTVRSGAEAIAKNKSDFVTLCDEWTGEHVPDNVEDKGVQATCENFGYVGDFDYSGYYTTYEELSSTTFEASARNADGTITVSVPRMDTLACKGLKIVVSDKDGKIITQREYKVPILVNQNANTDDAYLFRFTADTCKTCDVVVRDNATLSVVDGGKNTVRDVMVYQGSALSVPQGNEYAANSLSFRRRESGTGDQVASLDYQGTLNLTHSSEKAVYLDLLISANNWHFLSLPYDCDIADVAFSNGQPAAYGTDWFLMYYDGERRASTQQTGSNWRQYHGTTIEAGKGYVVGIKGNTAKPDYIYELRFPMAKEVLAQESTDKMVSVNAYGAATDIRPNHKGWNLVGNPYLNYYKKEGTASFQGLVSGLLVYDPVTGYWSLDDEGERNHPYITIPQNFGWTAYNQVLASETPLSPFTCYFLQVTGATDGEERAIAFSHAQRGRAAMPMLTRQTADEPVIVDVVLRNAAGEQDHTALVIDDRFTDDYEMDADFFKWFGDYYRRYTQPVIYTLGTDGGKRAFNAVSEQTAAQPVSVGYFASHAGEYTFSLNRTSDLARLAEVWLFDVQTGTYTNLLQQDYTFTTSPTDGAGRFSVNVRLLPKVTTGVDNLDAGNLRISSSCRMITVSGLPSSASLWLYDAAGKLISSERTSTWQRTYTVPQSGTYFIRVETMQGANTLSTVVE